MTVDRFNGRNADGTFSEGNAGKPRGARNKATLAVLDLLDGQVDGANQHCNIGAPCMCIGRLIGCSVELCPQFVNASPKPLDLGLFDLDPRRW